LGAFHPAVLVLDTVPHRRQVAFFNILDLAADLADYHLLLTIYIADHKGTCIQHQGLL
jgi:hypothetical protein